MLWATNWLSDFGFLLNKCALHDPVKKHYFQKFKYIFELIQYWAMIGSHRLGPIDRSELVQKQGYW
jgi:hypothetical protein